MKRLWPILASLIVLSGQAHAAWWNSDWPYRKKVTVNAGESGAAIKETLQQVAVPVRLHTGNFVFADSKEDGSDVRFVAADDKTPLKHHVESWDAANELAIVWVQLPRVTGGAAAESIWLYYGNKKAAKAEDAKGGYDASQLLVLHFSEKDGAPRDQTAYGHHAAEFTAKRGSAGILGGAAVFDGEARIRVPAAPGLKLEAGGGFTFSAWVKSAEPQSANLFSWADGDHSIAIGIDDNQAAVRIGGAKPAVDLRGGALAPGAWHHLAVTIGGGKAALYVDGAAAGSADGALPAMAGGIVIGAAAGKAAGFKGEIDELQLAGAARSADWVKLAFAAQGQDGKLLTFGDEEQTGGAGHSYFGILIDNLTVDAWVVIVILMAMLVASFVIMILKARFLLLTERANDAFIDHFEGADADMLALHGAGTGGVPNGEPEEQKLKTRFGPSPLYRLYETGMREVRHRDSIYRGQGRAISLTPQAVNAIRASLDASIVRESARLNSQMVLLTIAISGGPFLGLLGTVVGVMITFAAIAAAGDVNINAIAPGIAAALLATVAGLAVAIPCLFGYNWLASRIKNISADMQVFADELLTKLAETYST